MKGAQYSNEISSLNWQLMFVVHWHKICITLQVIIVGVKTLRQNNIFQYILLNEMFYILFQISVNFALWRPIINSALVQVMAWRQTGDKPLPEPMVN